MGRDHQLPPDRYRRLFEQSTAPQLVVAPPDGRVVEANRAAEEFYGTPLQALRGTTLQSLATDDALTLRDSLDVAAAVGMHLTGVRLRLSNGETRHVEVYGTPFQIDDECLVHLIVHDVTERERSSERERQFLAQLARQDARQREQTMIRMGELVAGVAHEVRTPLFALSSALDALQQRLSENTHFARYAPLMAGQVQRLSALMAALLDYGRPQALILRDTLVSELLHSAVELSAAANAQRIAIVVADTCSPAQTLRVDRFRVAQALQNLLVNAIQHAPNDSQIELSARQVGQSIEFAIEDSGPGFDSESLASAFEPFFTKRPGGTGLGLALVHRIVHDHGGLVFVENRTDGEGTRLGARVRVRFL